MFGLVAPTAWAMSRLLEKAIYPAPVIVVGAAALAGLVLLWGKAAWQQLGGRAGRHS